MNEQQSKAELDCLEDVLRDGVATRPTVGPFFSTTMKCLVDELDRLRARIAELEGARARDMAELAGMRADHRELSNQFIANVQMFGSVIDNWRNWAVEIVGKEAARKMSGQDMRDEILRRLADRAPAAQAEPQDTSLDGAAANGPGHVID